MQTELISKITNQQKDQALESLPKMYFTNQEIIFESIFIDYCKVARSRLVYYSNFLAINIKFPLLKISLGLYGKLTETSKSQKIDSKVSTQTKTKTFQNFNMPPPLDIQKHFYKTNSRLPITTVLYQAKARQRDTAGGALLFQAAIAWAIQGYLNCHTICQLDRELLGSSLLPEGFKLLHSIQRGFYNQLFLLSWETPM